MGLAEIAQLLKAFPRQGAELDHPEGARYIQISDTLANLLADAIEEEIRHASV